MDGYKDEKCSFRDRLVVGCTLFLLLLLNAVSLASGDGPLRYMYGHFSSCSPWYGVFQKRSHRSNGLDFFFGSVNSFLRICDLGIGTLWFPYPRYHELKAMIHYARPRYIPILNKMLLEDNKITNRETPSRAKLSHVLPPTPPPKPPPPSH